MKLDRNINVDGKGKYMLINLRKGEIDHQLSYIRKPYTDSLIACYRVPVDMIEAGMQGESDEFFVIKLKDKYAMDALRAYADAARVDDPEYADEIQELAERSGPNNFWCKKPD